MSGYTEAQNHLLPNEDVLFASQTQSGPLVLSDRRVVIMRKKGHSGYNVDRAIPYGCISSFSAKKSDRLIVSGKVLEAHGVQTKETASIELKVRERDSLLNQCLSILDVIRNSRTTPPVQRDFSYLDDLPESLTHNAILDLNTVLRDQPVHDELVHEAKKFLGDEPFLIEDSLREANDRNNGVLFAAGKRGYYWVRGVKQGRFLVNVIVDSVEWDNLQCLTHQWQDENPFIYASYSLTKGGKNITSQYVWKPPINEETNHYPWLIEPLNGPWILADVMYKCSGKSFGPRFYH
ncbi:MAG: hypothetical protein RTV41_13535 [Candidatus Thorarchaeota archaeon]